MLRLLGIATVAAALAGGPASAQGEEIDRAMVGGRSVILCADGTWRPASPPPSRDAGAPGDDGLAQERGVEIALLADDAEVGLHPAAVRVDGVERAPGRLEDHDRATADGAVQSAFRTVAPDAPAAAPLVEAVVATTGTAGR